MLDARSPRGVRSDTVLFERHCHSARRGDGDASYVATFVAFLTNCGLGVVQAVVERQAGVQDVMTTVRNNNDNIVHHTGRKLEGGRGDGRQLSAAGCLQQHFRGGERGYRTPTVIRNGF